MEIICTFPFKYSFLHVLMEVALFFGDNVTYMQGCETCFPTYDVRGAGIGSNHKILQIIKQIKHTRNF